MNDILIGMNNMYIFISVVHTYKDVVNPFPLNSTSLTYKIELEICKYIEGYVERWGTNE